MDNYFYTRIFPTRANYSGSVPLIIGITLVLIGLFILVFPEILVLVIAGSIIWLGATIILGTLRLKRETQRHPDSIEINIKN